MAYYPGSNGVVHYEEGLDVGYRGFAAAEASAPLFPFGHGLSYTQFEYHGLSAAFDRQQEEITVTVTLSNQGERAGDEVIQIYASFVGLEARRPTLMLVGFSKVSLLPGETLEHRLIIPRERLGYWCVDRQAYAYEAAPCTLHLGRSASDLSFDVALRVD
jgi:beta-glucosidase